MPTKDRLSRSYTSPRSASSILLVAVNGAVHARATVRDRTARQDGGPDSRRRGSPRERKGTGEEPAVASRVCSVQLRMTARRGATCER